LKKIGGTLFFGLCGMFLANTSLAACNSKPLIGIPAGFLASLSPISAGGNYRVLRIHSDQVLIQTWAMVIRCDHPEWPAVALSLRDSTLSLRLKEQESAKDIPAAVVVHAGEIVRLWRQEISWRIEAAGISETNGRLGDLVKVRLLRRNTDDQSIEEQFSGIVRGPSDVEMKP
jgi:hypothetical protein